MSEECGLTTAREEYALTEHETQLLELPQEASKFNKHDVKELAYKIHGGPVGLANALKKYRSENTTPNHKYGPNILEADLSQPSPSCAAVGAISNIISTPLSRAEHLSDPKTLLWKRYFTCSSAACPCCGSNMQLSDPTTFEIQHILPYTGVVDDEEWNNVILCSKDEDNNWGCAEKIERENVHVLDYVLAHYPTHLYEMLLRQQLLYGSLFDMPVTTCTTLRFAHSVYGIGADTATAKYNGMWAEQNVGFTSDLLTVHDALMRVCNSDLLMLTHLKQKESLPSATPSKTAANSTARKRLVCSARKETLPTYLEETPSSRSPKRKMSSNSASPRPKRRSMGRSEIAGRLFSEADDPFCDV